MGKLIEQMKRKHAEEAASLQRGHAQAVASLTSDHERLSRNVDELKSKVS